MPGGTKFARILSIGVVVAILLWGGSTLLAQIGWSTSPFAGHIDLPSDEPEEAAKPAGPVEQPTVSSDTLQTTGVIKRFLDNEGRIWLVESEGGQRFIMRFAPGVLGDKHFFLPGHRIAFTARLTDIWRDGVRVILVDHVEEFLPEREGPLPAPLITALTVTENRLPEYVAFQVSGHREIEKVDIAVLVTAVLAGQSEIIWSERTDRIWDPEMGAWIFKMYFDVKDLPGIARDPKATFTIEAWPALSRDQQVYRITVKQKGKE